MKKLVILLVAVFGVSFASAQSFNVGTSVVQAGIGLGSNLGGLGKGRPALSVSYEYGKWAVGGPGVISLGGYIGNTGYKYTAAGYSQKWDYTIIGLRSAYHYNGFTDAPQLDVYGGAMLSYNNVSYKTSGVFSGSNAYGSGVDFSLYLGGRWFFNENFGAFAELGYGVSTLNLGLSYRF
jgi:outer membrane protease